jgi:hypothetical protein
MSWNVSVLLKSLIFNTCKLAPVISERILSVSAKIIVSVCFNIEYDPPRYLGKAFALTLISLLTNPVFLETFLKIIIMSEYSF